ncbi:hypothetical protein CTAYLR_008052 [Chrysophaeum taylorii]|uniref:Uncharacterized protein n=1 Tax=Chrysophaeum taylorii TaxID=2483200 RepID=A0AAD7XKG2_9STRA|nr:hypothetical protein CTAYLR_008052 [Chrysophaeum taylorii]
MSRGGLLFVVVVVAAASADPRLMNITIYHVNSLEDGVVPVNMDSSNLAGDVFFDLRSIVLPVECGTQYAWTGDCDNAELTASDAVISKLVLEVDTRYGEYARCNYCDNGTDPFSGLACQAGEYFCTCGDYMQSYQCTETEVGKENISIAFANFTCTWDTYVVAPWRCWSTNVAQKTGGLWYSTLSTGECPGPNCTWRLVSVDKVVSKNCSNDVIFDAVESADQVACFDACGYPRNTSSACWIGCFYQTVLGPEGMLPTPYPGFKHSGMSLDDLVDAWTRPFNFDDPAMGGCPPIDWHDVDFPFNNDRVPGAADRIS